MTTVTPSDRVGATSSAERPAAIPTQRSDRALRLLVLGTGHDASAFRERAAQAGAELAQRFSVRVTHVVAEDGVGEQDARVVRARTAGVPVLGVVDGERLLEDRAHEVGSETSVEAAAEAEPAAEVEVEAAPVAVVVADVDTEPDAGDEAEGDEGSAVTIGSDSDDESSSGEADSHRRVMSLIGHRTEVTPEPGDVRPSDVFTESALEAVLHFPPLRADDEDWQGEPHELIADVRAGEATASVRLTPTPSPSPSPSPSPTTRTTASVAWALLPLVSIGLLTPVGIGYAAYRLRSRKLAAATGCYTLAVAAAFAVSATAPARTGTHAASGELVIACLGVSSFGGAVHSFLIRRRVFGHR